MEAEIMRVLVTLIAGIAMLGAARSVTPAHAQYPDVGPIEIYQGWFNDNHWILYQQADGSTFWVCEYCHWG